MGWLAFDPVSGKSQPLTDGKSSGRWIVQREPVSQWEERIQARVAEVTGEPLTVWELESDGWVYFLMTEGGTAVTPAMEVEAMSLILKRRNLKPIAPGEP